MLGGQSIEPLQPPRELLACFTLCPASLEALPRCSRQTHDPAKRRRPNEEDRDPDQYRKERRCHGARAYKTPKKLGSPNAARRGFPSLLQLPQIRWFVVGIKRLIDQQLLQRRGIATIEVWIIGKVLFRPRPVSARAEKRKIVRRRGHG